MNSEARIGASYGENLLDELANRLAALKVSNCNRREHYRYLRFYRLYPSIVGTLSPQLVKLLPAARHAARKVGTASPQLHISSQRLLQNLSYSHLEQLIDIDDDLKRAFYEIECLRGNWLIRELKRQIGSLYFERSGLSGNKRRAKVLETRGSAPSKNS
jgi:hypothetical protein